MSILVSLFATLAFSNVELILSPQVDRPTISAKLQRRDLIEVVLRTNGDLWVGRSAICTYWKFWSLEYLDSHKHLLRPKAHAIDEEVDMPHIVPLDWVVLRGGMSLSFSMPQKYMSKDVPSTAVFVRVRYRVPASYQLPKQYGWREVRVSRDLTSNLIFVARNP